jgi:hypothetical protein
MAKCNSIRIPCSFGCRRQNDVAIPGELVDSAKYVYQGPEGSVNVEANLATESTLEVIPQPLVVSWQSPYLDEEAPAALGDALNEAIRKAEILPGQIDIRWPINRIPGKS